MCILASSQLSCKSNLTIIIIYKRTQAYFLPNEYLTIYSLLIPGVYAIKITHRRI